MVDFKPRTIGILGGMGPEATSRLFERIIALTPAKQDQEHLPVVICNLPQIPDRTAAIQGQGESPVPLASKGLQMLAAGADFIAIPCNSIHHFFPELQAAVSVPILHLITEVHRAALQRWPQARRLGLLATDGMIQSGVYQKLFAASNCEIIVPDASRQKEVMASLYAIKAGEKRFREALAAGRDLLDRRAQGLILGCTELSLVRNFLANDLPVIDSIEVLAQACVEVARGMRENF
jgi:aspartate racemase